MIDRYALFLYPCKISLPGNTNKGAERYDIEPTEVRENTTAAEVQKDTNLEVRKDE